MACDLTTQPKQAKHAVLMSSLSILSCLWTYSEVGPMTVPIPFLFFSRVSRLITERYSYQLFETSLVSDNMFTDDTFPTTINGSKLWLSLGRQNIQYNDIRYTDIWNLIAMLDNNYGGLV